MTIGYIYYLYLLFRQILLTYTLARIITTLKTLPQFTSTNTHHKTAKAFKKKKKNCILSSQIGNALDTDG